MKDYITVKGESQIETVIERSRFITYITNANDEESAKAFIEKIKKAHPFATHNCYAYSVGENGEKQKYSDDGEPQGTAGLPMLEIIKKKEIVNVCAVVTRYFGGIKLGAGGLVRAYAGAVADGLDNAIKVKYTVSAVTELTIAYDKYGKLLNFLENKKLVVLDTAFDTEIKVKLIMPETDFEGTAKSIADLFSGTVILNKISVDFYPYEV